MNWLFKSRKTTSASPPTKVARPTYPFQVILLVENLENWTQPEKDLYDEINTATSEYEIPLTIREYDLFHPVDSKHVRYLPSYHIYSNSKWRSTHSTSGNVKRRLENWIAKFEKKFGKL